MEHSVPKQMALHTSDAIAITSLSDLGRVIHGTNPRVWLNEVQQRIGEKGDYISAGGQ